MASGVSALMVMGTVTYVATGCGTGTPFSQADTGNAATIQTASMQTGPIQPSVAPGNMATINGHGLEGVHGPTTVPLDIPEDVYQAQLRAAEAYDFPWEYIAAVAARESHNGQLTDPGVPRGTRNDAGAAGIMQFGVEDPNTGSVGAANNAWGGKPVERVEDRARHYEVGELPSRTDMWDYFGIDGNGDGVVDVWDPWDSIISGTFKLAYMRNLAENHPRSVVARDCRTNGHPDPLECAIYRHNPASSYVAQINEIAALYADSEYAVGPALNITPASFTTAANGEECVDVTGASSQAPWGLSGSVGEAHRTAVEFALQQVGKPYVWGGTGPDGWDCSGLTQGAWQAAGIGIPRITTEQWNPDHPGWRGARAERVQQGGSMDVDALQPGDLIFIHYSGGVNPPSHMTMYIGNGEMVHAPRRNKNVEVVPANERNGEFVGVVRIFPLSSETMAA